MNALAAQGQALWSGLSSAPLLWLAVTLAVFEGADWISRRSGRHPLCHPVLWATPALIAILLVTRTPYPAYAQGAGFLSFLLGPATVALAVPLWRNRATIRRVGRPLAAALVAGSLTSIICGAGILWAFGAPRAIIASVAPRASTTPVAMAVAHQLGGPPALAAAIVLASGVMGAMALTPLMNRLGVTNDRASGLAAGVAAHGFGTARAFQVSEIAGAFAGIGMALNAVLTALLLSVAALFL